MKKTTLFLLLFSASLMCAEEYTIMFDDMSSEFKTIDNIVLSSTDNCVSSVRYANKISRSSNIGIKGGTASVKGILCLQLDQPYAITSMTLYAYPFNSTDARQSILLCGKEISWNKDNSSYMFPYTITLNQTTDSITICSKTDKNNRWYAQKLVFTADDPNPNAAKMTTPLAYDGFSNIIDGEAAKDVINIPVESKNVVDDIQIALKNKKVYTLNASTLPSTGGEINVAYTLSKQGKYYDTLFVSAVGKDGATLRRAIPLYVMAKNYTAPVIHVDSACMRIGKMPGDYYQPAQGLKDSALKAALSEVVHCGPRYRYGSGELHTWDGFYHTDRDTTTNQVLDMYSNNVRYFNPANPTGSIGEFDIEHMLPKSWWGGEVNEAYRDLFHLVPADYSANRSKSNHAPGIPSDSTFNNGSFVTGSGKAYGLTRVFCPADEYKGDFARAYFYIVTCYDTLHWETKGDAGQAMTNSDYHDFQPWLQDLLMSWHRLDPVSDKEKARAIEVNKIQGNRNPFIDYPELAEYIWGNQQGTEVNFYNLTQSFGDPYNDDPSAISTIATISDDIRKFMVDDQVYIVIDGVVYTILGENK